MDYLFNGIDWFSVEKNQKAALLEEVESINGNRLLNTSTDDLCVYFEEEYRIDVPILYDDKITVDQQETKVDVSGDRSRYIRDRSRAYYIPGSKIEISVPFEGDKNIFDIQPTSFSSVIPHAVLKNNVIIFYVEGIDLKREQVKSAILVIKQWEEFRDRANRTT